VLGDLPARCGCHHAGARADVDAADVVAAGAHDVQHCRRPTTVLHLAWGCCVPLIGGPYQEVPCAAGVLMTSVHTIAASLHGDRDMQHCPGEARHFVCRLALHGSASIAVPVQTQPRARGSPIRADLWEENCASVT
jgi:hypothetical protein